MSIWPFAVIAILILFNALYVAAEFAVVGARVSRVEHFAAQGKWLARAVLPIVSETRRLDNYIAACQIGITISSLVLGAFGQATLGWALGQWLHTSMEMDTVTAFGVAALVVLVTLTSMQVVLGELIPKTVALQYPVRTAMYTYLPMKWSLVVFTPFIRFLNGSGNLVLRLFGAAHAAGHHHVHAPEEIEMLLRESTEGGAIAEDEGARLQAGLRLARRSARQLMVPRRDVAGLDLDEDAASLLDQIGASPYTRLIAYRGSLDDVRGLLHIKDVAALLGRGGAGDDLETLLRPLLKVPGGLSAERVLNQLRQHRARLALVVSEFGDVEGLVTLQDLVSEVLGETPDEFKAAIGDRPVQLERGRWRCSGLMPVDEFLAWAEVHGYAEAIDPGGASTLAGLVMERLDAVPVEGQSLLVGDMRLTVERMRGAAIESLLVQARTQEDAGHG